MALLRSATCIVGGDTGPLHLAIALGTPAVALFGPTDPGAQRPLPQSMPFSKGRGHHRRYRSWRRRHRPSRCQQRHLPRSQRSNRSIHAGHYRRVGPQRRPSPHRCPFVNAAFFARWRVRLGYPLAIVVLALAHPTPQSILYGALVGAIGLFIRAMAAGHLHKQQVLTVTGPYAYTRNPLYLGSAILAAGVAVAIHSWISAVTPPRLFRPVLFRRHAPRGARTSRSPRRSLRTIRPCRTTLSSQPHPGKPPRQPRRRIFPGPIQEEPRISCRHRLPLPACRSPGHLAVTPPLRCSLQSVPARANSYSQRRDLVAIARREP